VVLPDFSIFPISTHHIKRESESIKFLCDVNKKFNRSRGRHPCGGGQYR
jgi:hypothetical protein